MRLIDADAIHYCNYDLDNYHSFRAVDEDEIADMPTIDAVPVVRCKDCMWFDTEDELADVFRKEKHCFCTEMNTYMSANDFCSCGERKDK